MTTPRRVYADTSVYGGAFDREFAEHSGLFFEQVKLGRFRLVTSALVEDELDPAPAEVQRLYQSLADLVETVPITPDAARLQQAYLDAGILSERSSEDALHVAVATVHGCEILVSWNYRHIVHMEKGPRYNAVNVLHGYPAVAIHSPAEVVSYEERL